MNQLWVPVWKSQETSEGGASRSFAGPCFNFRVEDLLHSADVSARKPHFDSVWVKRRSREDIPNYSSRECARALITLKNNVYFEACANVLSLLPIHS